MEAHADTDATTPRPTAQEAQAALDAADEARSTVDRVPAPWWFFPALAVVMVGLAFGQMLPTPVAIPVILAFAAGAGVTVGGYVAKVGIRPRVNVPAAVLGAVSIALIFVTAAVVDQPWAWIAAGLVNAAVVLVAGYLHQRRARGSA